MSDTWAEIQQQGSSVDPQDVVRAPTERQPRENAPRRSERREEQPRREQPRRRGQSRAAEETDLPRDERGRFLPQSSQDDDETADFASVLADPGDETAEQPPRRRARGVDPDDERDDAEDDDDAADVDYDDADDDDEEDPDYEISDDADEAEGDRTLAPEGDDDDDEDEDRPARRERGEGRRPRFGKKVDRYIRRQVESLVAKTIEENNKLREAEAARQQTDEQTAKFFGSVLGTDEQLQQLEAVALDTRRPQVERDRAAQALGGFKRNRQFAEQYRQGLERVIRLQEAQAIKAVTDKVAEFKALDKSILESGDRAKVMAHCIQHGIQLATEKLEPELRKWKKRAQTRAGIEDDRRVARGVGRRPSIAQAAGRRANGRIPRPDPLRGAMEKTRGLAPGSSLDMLSDELLDRVRRGETTLAEIGLGQVAV